MVVLVDNIQFLDKYVDGSTDGEVIDALLLLLLLLMTVTVVVAADDEEDAPDITGQHKVAL